MISFIKMCKHKVQYESTVKSNFNVVLLGFCPLTFLHNLSYNNWIKILFRAIQHSLASSTPLTVHIITLYGDFLPDAGLFYMTGEAQPTMVNP